MSSAPASRAIWSIWGRKEVLGMSGNFTGRTEPKVRSGFRRAGTSARVATPLRMRARRILVNLRRGMPRLYVGILVFPSQLCREKESFDSARLGSLRSGWQMVTGQYDSAHFV